MASYAISDIHGCCKTLKHMCENVLHLGGEDRLFVLGDHIDHGPCTREVLDYFETLQATIGELVLLRGNHEQRLLKAYDSLDDEVRQEWLENGGKEALQSFGVDSIDSVPSCYIDMLSSMVYYHEEKDYVMVHAGFDFSAEAPFSQYDNMLEIRGWTYDKEQVNGRTILHGHTPTPYDTIRKQVQSKSPVICLDNGCGKEGDGLGNLVAYEMGTGNLYSQICLDV